VKWKSPGAPACAAAGGAAGDDVWRTYATGKKPLDQGALRTSGEITVPMILDITLNRGNFRPAVNVLNRDGYIANLPLDAAVEVRRWWTRAAFTRCTSGHS